jgi:hypothetical protein
VAENPYAPPKADLSPAANAELEGLWRDRRLLVMNREARLPPTCVKCGDPEVRRLKKTLYWHHPAVYLALIVNVLIYAVLALVLRKSAKIEVPLCRRHNHRRSMMLAVGATLCVAGAGGCTAAVAREDAFLLWSVLGAVVGAIVMILGERVVWPKKIDERRLWLHGAGPPFLLRLAVWPRP